MNIEKVISALKQNKMNGIHITSRDMLWDELNKLIPNGSTVGYGGSITLAQLGVLDRLRENKNITLFDREKSGDRVGDMKRSLTADVFLMSTNAVTEQGELFNVDGNGNRCAALIYGPDKVVIICGTNKIVKNIEEAELRLKNIAAPMNTKRLDCDTPCKVTGKCMNCKSDARICCSYVVTRQQRVKNRINVLILDERLGY